MAGIGVGLIGTGFMGKSHALAWNAVAPVFGDVERPRLACLFDVTTELAAAKAREFGFDRSTTDWRALIDDPDVHIVSITSPNQHHAEMAIYALERGKHVWCEKPMAPSIVAAEAMTEAARKSGRLAFLGYNYIQNPAIRLARKLIAEGAIGPVNHVRLEMDEDFMADATTPFSWRSLEEAGYGALDDFSVHTLSLLKVLMGGVAQVFCTMAKPYPTRPEVDGRPRAVETFDIATMLLRLEGGASGVISVNRAAWGRKGRIFIQLFGAEGAIVFDQERCNEIELFQAQGPDETRGFRKILTAPVHPPYGKFVPAPGHGLGFNDLKIIEARELLRAIAGEPAHILTFEDGIRIERTVHAAAASFRDERWVDVEAAPGV